MPDVLAMPAGEFGNPIAMLVLVISDDRLLGHFCRQS
jgi:hypothetical protein